MIAETLKEIYLDFKAGFGPVVVISLLALGVVWGLKTVFTPEIAIGILLAGFAIYATTMLGGLRRTRMKL
tara:strand:- start:147 stop:356 length:210 start_codon:yes stop_codon:yes gene_type:complete